MKNHRRYSTKYPVKFKKNFQKKIVVTREAIFKASKLHMLLSILTPLPHLPPLLASWPSGVWCKVRLFHKQWITTAVIAIDTACDVRKSITVVFNRPSGYPQDIFVACGLAATILWPFHHLLYIFLFVGVIRPSFEFLFCSKKLLIFYIREPQLEFFE